MSGVKRYLKQGSVIFAVYLGLMLLSEAYVYPELRFDFSSLKEGWIWTKVLFQSIVFSAIWVVVVESSNNKLKGKEE